jgi:hypothetical protein
MRRGPEAWLFAVSAVLLGYALLRAASDVSNEWLMLGLAYTLVVLFALRGSASLDWRRFWPFLLLPLCITAQLLPWPARSEAPWLTVLQLARVIVYLSLFLAVREMAAAQPTWRWKLLALPLAFGCIEAVTGIIQHAVRGLDNYALGSYGDHSHFSGLMDLLLPLTIVFAIQYRHPIAFAPPLIAFAAQLDSFSRAGMAASALAILAMVVIRTKRFKMAGATALALIVATLLFAPIGLSERFERISTYQGFRDDAQLVRWRDTLRLIAARPVLGSGAGAYRQAFAAFNTSTEAAAVSHADNDYLQLLAEIGVAGFLAVLALLTIALRQCVRGARESLLALGAAGSMIALLAHSVFEFQLYIPANVLTLAWIAGAGCGASTTRSYIS